MADINTTTHNEVIQNVKSMAYSKYIKAHIFGVIIIIIIIIIKQENDYSDVRQLIAVARALHKIKLKTHMLIVQ